MPSKIKEQILARKLRSKGLSLKEISNKLNVSKSSVSMWVREVNLGEEQIKKIWERERIGGIKGRQKSLETWKVYRLSHPKLIKKPRWPTRNAETFFNQWTADMAYILGYFAADGTMFRNPRGSHYISFCSTDNELIHYVKDTMDVTNKIEVYPQTNEKHKTFYVLQIGSKKLYNRLIELGFTPTKSLTLNFPIIPDKFLNHFIRGYFDGDGCAFFKCYKRKDRKNNSLTIQLSIRFISGSYVFLKSLHESISQIAGINGGSLINRSDHSYELVYSLRNVLELYRFLYPNESIVCLKRKRDKLKEGIEFWGRSSVG